MTIKRSTIVALQETLASTTSLTGYREVPGQPGGRGICTLIDKKVTYLSYDLKLASCKVEHVMVEILLNPPPHNQRSNSVFVLNAYSNPKHWRQQFKTLLEKALELAGPRPFVIVGDFSAPHGLWGYLYESSKGRDLWQDANELDLTLITN
ncbi:hypothetical protein HPB49_010841 [Dermacentor silvarum]|uniref:Uncharacterized protein n=1 Tax=Dermacentor silvarum TaxID=543639 RepID=A0ACB8C314_DERSI|nr:hypothetical protein HPB49_010841 [Dermacentor silvarum]